jgi:hypothetical protein
VSWKHEYRKSLRENKLLNSFNFKVDGWIMFFILKSFMEIINHLELSHSFICLNNFSIPGDESVDPKKKF